MWMVSVTWFNTIAQNPFKLDFNPKQLVCKYPKPYFRVIPLFPWIMNVYNNWLVVWNMFFFHRLGIVIFFRGVETTNQWFHLPPGKLTVCYLKLQFFMGKSSFTITIMGLINRLIAEGAPSWSERCTKKGGFQWGISKSPWVSILSYGHPILTTGWFGLPSGYVKIAIENGYRNSGFSH